VVVQERGTTTAFNFCLRSSDENLHYAAHINLRPRWPMLTLHGFLAGTGYQPGELFI